MSTPLSASSTPTRCVIYTRKSSDEGLEQDFNSLDAQREACEAYVKSQAHEGWVLLKHRYDDGGFSGGSMHRPALERLMADIETDGIDLIVVYKVDRLSRSLADFSKMVETFEQFGVSFVSITQQFNTSTSMGRLTLNVLLSFAQFEREVTGERIRDKIAASKKKGMWMGGRVPLGYDNHDRTLVINTAEAERVRHIYRRYLALGSVKQLKEELDQQNIRSKVRKNGAGCQPFSRGALYALLTNPLYIGMIRHKAQLHAGTHAPIIGKAMWDSVQKKLSKNRNSDYLRTQAKAPSLLAGLLFDESGHPFSPTHTRKKSRRYRYYVNQAVLQFKGTPVDALARVPAQAVESVVEAQTCKLLANSARLLRVLAPLTLPATEQQTLLHQATQLSETWEEMVAHQKIEHLSVIVRKITLSRSMLRIAFSLPGMVQVSVQHHGYQGEETHEVRIPITLKRCGVETKLLVEQTRAQNNLKPHADSLRAMQEALKKALGWNAALVSGTAKSTRLLAEESGVSQRYVAQLVKLAYLSPAIIQRILKGNVPHDLTLGKLKTGIPYGWKEQESLFSS